MSKLLPVLAASLIALATACGAPVDDRVTAVEQLDLERYLGTWYDVGSFEQSFQVGCHCTTANYALDDDGSVEVTNTCRKDGPDGPEDTAVGRAYRPDDAEPAKLRVEFFPPFGGDYWVILLDEPAEGEDYQWAVVSEPTKQYLWVLSRTPVLDAGVEDEIMEELRALDYELERFIPSRQAGCWDDA
jgi:apolipoprotein D and lipocalin family protein